MRTTTHTARHLPRHTRTRRTARGSDRTRTPANGARRFRSRAPRRREAGPACIGSSVRRQRVCGGVPGADVSLRRGTGAASRVCCRASGRRRSDGPAAAVRGLLDRSVVQGHKQLRTRTAVKRRRRSAHVAHTLPGGPLARPAPHASVAADDEHAAVVPGQQADRGSVVARPAAAAVPRRVDAPFARRNQPPRLGR